MKQAFASFKKVSTRNILITHQLRFSIKTRNWKRFAWSYHSLRNFGDSIDCDPKPLFNSSGLGTCKSLVVLLTDWTGLDWLADLLFWPNLWSMRDMCWRLSVAWTHSSFKEHLPLNGRWIHILEFVANVESQKLQNRFESHYCVDFPDSFELPNASGSLWFQECAFIVRLWLLLPTIQKCRRGKSVIGTVFFSFFCLLGMLESQQSWRGKWAGFKLLKYVFPLVCWCLRCSYGKRKSLGCNPHSGGDSHSTGAKPMTILPPMSKISVRVFASGISAAKVRNTRIQFACFWSVRSLLFPQISHRHWKRNKQMTCWIISDTKWEHSVGYRRSKSNSSQWSTGLVNGSGPYLTSQINTLREFNQTNQLLIQTRKVHDLFSIKLGIKFAINNRFEMLWKHF
jgi:hypothetical protein